MQNTLADVAEEILLVKEIVSSFKGDDIDLTRIKIFEDNSRAQLLVYWLLPFIGNYWNYRLIGNYKFIGIIRLLEIAGLWILIYVESSVYVVLVYAVDTWLMWNSWFM